MSCTYDIVRSELLRGDIKSLESIYSEMKGKIQCSRSSQELLANVYSPEHAIARNFAAKSYLPKSAREGKNEASTAIR